jgi:hypothetical protein
MVFPQGYGAGKGTHLSVFLELQDAMWAPAAVKYKLTVVNQADASKSVSLGKSQPMMRPYCRQCSNLL